MSYFRSLPQDQKESIGILQMGNLLEYFDLMLYIHMANILNDLFFPTTDPQAATLLSAFAFCSAWVFRPIGALFFGWVGDHIGRKPTFIITTFLMATSCVVMATLPTYAEIGIAAAWIVTICRIVQGMSSMSEMVGAEIYLTESINPPARNAAVAMTGFTAGLGGLFALGIADLATTQLFDWRIAFWIGALIAFAGLIARNRLKETPEFLKKSRNIQKKSANDMPFQSLETNKDRKSISNLQHPDQKKTLLSYFFVSCGWPLCFYIVFLHFTPILKQNFGYSSHDIIKHNFWLALISSLVGGVVVYLCRTVNPLKISKNRGIVSLFLMIALPFLIMNSTSPTHLFLIQAVVLVFPITDWPSGAVYISHFNFYRRFTNVSFLWAMGRGVVYVVSSFGIIYLSRYFGEFGIWFVALPIAFSFLYGIRNFEELENKKMTQVIA